MEMLDLDSVDWKASKKDRNKNGPKWKMLTPMSTPRSSHTVEVRKQFNEKQKKRIRGHP